LGVVGREKAEKLLLETTSRFYPGAEPLLLLAAAAAFLGSLFLLFYFLFHFLLSATTRFRTHVGITSAKFWLQSPARYARGEEAQHYE